jgi:hypothetical protein
MYLFFENTIIGSIDPDESDPPMGSGYFTFAENVAETLRAFLVFTHREFELPESSAAYKTFEKELDEKFGEWYYSNQWKIGESIESAKPISYPMLSKEGLLMWLEEGE